MFTGIVEELGVVLDIEPRGADSARLRVRGPRVTSDAGRGSSIAVNGVCLTAIEVRDGTFTVDVMRETLVRSSLGGLRSGSPVNLERPLAADGRFGGHIVQGHVDGTGEVLTRTKAEHWDLLRVSLPGQLRRYVVEKGSIALDGVSLTVAHVDDSSFTVGLIPTTLALTTLGHLQPGDAVNLEVDVLAKYVEKMLVRET